jgi:hypothetical protein
MVYTLHKLKTLNLNLDFEFQQLLASLKHVINIILGIKYMGCYNFGYPQAWLPGARVHAMPGCEDEVDWASTQPGGVENEP